MARKNIIFCGKLTQGHPGFNLVYSPGTSLDAGFTGRATPHLFLVYLGQPKSRLADELAHTELPNPVPRANSITQPALVAVLERIATVLFDDLNYFFFGGYGFHDMTCPFFLPESVSKRRIQVQLSF
jgi:hypothetical protein